MERREKRCINKERPNERTRWRKEEKEETNLATCYCRAGRVTLAFSRIQATFSADRGSLWACFLMPKRASRYDVCKIFASFWSSSPLSTFGSDLYYKIHAPSPTMSAFPWPPPPSDADIISVSSLMLLVVFTSSSCTVTLTRVRIKQNCGAHLSFGT